MIHLCDPVLGDEEKRAVSEVIDSGWLSMGENVRKFELAFAELHGMNDAVAVSSCTAGLHLCLEGLGIGPGDEVLVPSLSFVATVNVVGYVGATPVFVDIDAMDVPHISLEDAERKCTSNTRAVIVMHYAGYGVDMIAWRDFANARGIFLVEDAAHAPGLTGVGRLGDACSFSFFPNKNLTTGEGGMVFACDPEILSRIRCLRSHGMTASTLDRHFGRASDYDVVECGYNYRMDEIRAALGVVQLGKLMKSNARRIELNSCYRVRLKDACPQVELLFDELRDTVAHILPVLLPSSCDRQAVVSHMRKCGIQTSMHYPPVHQFTCYRDYFHETSLPLTEEFSGRELTLPLHPGMTEQDVDHVVFVLVEALESSERRL